MLELCPVLPSTESISEATDRSFASGSGLVIRHIRSGGRMFLNVMKKGVKAMPSQHYTRSTGKRLTYLIVYDKGEYFIERDGLMKKAVPDAMATGFSPSEATPKMMLRLAIGDIESLNGMEE
jgi:hypothetical protein